MNRRKYKMRTVIKIKDFWWQGSTGYHSLVLECGHNAVLQWNRKTKYVTNKTKSRCYECAKQKKFKGLF
jgi:hypothetical protein